MCKQAFNALVLILEQDPLLHTSGPNQQLPTWVQLHIFLRHLSNGDDVFDLVSKFSISEGKILKIVKRITLAIQRLHSKYITWPNIRRKDEIKSKFLEMTGFPSVVGVVDGTHFRLNHAPNKDPETYWTRKKEYAIHAQLIVDSDFRFIHFEIGWPGSVHDARVYMNSQFYRRREELLHPPEYIIGDSAYPLSPFCITPFQTPRCRQEITFNTILSRKVRNIVERTINRLKKRFPAFNSLRLREMETNVRLISCGIILHNFIVSFGDEWEDDRVGITEDSINGESNISEYDRIERILGKEKRDALLTEVLSRNGCA
ncbi:uncharacterized protein VTP21DRAFT_8143 [Calcarisporiella thermophila]|uniref:uncharacterized protein n=1 Tax=Calcarisporiella thermophila TaxID=911321 RepID=UPI00374320C0